MEILEGPLGPATSLFAVAVNTDTGLPDTTVNDFDDVLVFTARSRGAPFVGRFGSGTIESHEAEIIWFVRGRTLYRRVLLIVPQALYQLDVSPDPDGDGIGDGMIGPDDLAALGASSLFGAYDISARPVAAVVDGSRPAPYQTNTYWVPNTLGDLAKRENRFAHRLHAMADAFPFDARRWGQMGMPTLCECSHPNWMSWNTPALCPR